MQTIVTETFLLKPCFERVRLEQAARSSHFTESHLRGQTTRRALMRGSPERYRSVCHRLLILFRCQCDGGATLASPRGRDRVTVEIGRATTTI